MAVRTAHPKSHPMTRPTRPIRATDGRISHPIQGFDSLHPLNLSTRQISVFPCEIQRNPSQDGRGMGHAFTLLLHRVCGVAA